MSLVVLVSVLQQAVRQKPLQDNPKRRIKLIKRFF